MSKCSFGVLWLIMMCLAPSCEAANAGCPGCNGNLPSCTWDNDGKCPTSATILLNSQVMAGTAAISASTDLSTLVKPRFLACFERVPLGLLKSLFNSPAKGTAFVLAVTTPVKAILDAVRQGQINLNTALSEYAGFIDDAEGGTDGSAKTALIARLTRNFNMLSSSSTSKAFVETSIAGDEGEGVWSYIWAKISIFIQASGDAAGKLVIQAAVASEIKSGSYSATFIPFVEEYQFYEALNYLYMFACTLGLCTAHTLSDFVHHVVFDTMGMKRRTWQYASELLLVMFRHLDRSARKLTLSNIYDESHLNSRMEEADRGMEKRYPKAAFFRTRGENPQRGNDDKPDKTRTDLKGQNIKWNKGDTKTGRPCLCFNSVPPRVHFSRELFDDGTCKGAHVCDKWVSNKGPNGRCLGTEGTAGHNRSACDNPNKCDERVQ